MLVVVVAEWLIGAIILMMNRKKDYARWISFTAFAAGLGGFSVIVGESMRPFIRNNILDNEMLDNLLALSTHVFSFIAQNVAPYTYILFCICYCGFFSNRMKKRLRVILFLPVLFMFAVSPIHPVFDLPHALMTLWVAPYVLFGDALLVYAYLREKDSILKRNLFLTNIIMIPPTLLSLVTNYFLRSFGIEETWRLNPWAIGIQIALFAIFIIKYEVLGVRLKFEERLGSTMRAMTLGTAILNHTIKGEVAKISMCANNMKKTSEEGSDPQMNESIEIISTAANHMLAMVARIQDKMQDIILNIEPNQATQILDHSLHLCSPHLENKRIQVIQDYKCDAEILCDPVHMKELLNNVFKNAIEAMEPSGKLIIELNRSKKHLTIIVKDNGAGITKETLPYVFDPFFSTKNNRSQNFGLGLSYCYNVMQKHGGMLDIHSEEKVGTTVSLHFPSRKIVRFTIPSEREVHYGNHTSSLS